MGFLYMIEGQGKPYESIHDWYKEMKHLIITHEL